MAASIATGNSYVKTASLEHFIRPYVRADRDDDVHTKLDQLPGQPGKSIALALGESPLDDKILAFGVTQLLEGRRQQHGDAAPVGRGRLHDLRQYPDSVHFLRLLGPSGGGEWPGEEATSDQHHELSALNHAGPARRWAGTLRRRDRGACGSRLDFMQEALLTG